MATRKRKAPAKRRSAPRRGRARTTRRTAARTPRAPVIKIVIENPSVQPQLPFGQPLPANVGNVAAATRKARF